MVKEPKPDTPKMPKLESIEGILRMIDSAWFADDSAISEAIYKKATVLAILRLAKEVEYLTAAYELRNP